MLYFTPQEFEKFKAAVKKHGGPTPEVRRELPYKEAAIMNLIKKAGLKNKRKHPMATATPAT